MFTTLWILLKLYPFYFFLVSCLNWVLGYWVGRALLRKSFHAKLAAMTNKYLTANQAALTWRDEVEDLVAKVGKD